MKALFIGSDAQLAEMVGLALKLRWPDVVVTAVREPEQGLELTEQELPDVVFYHSDHDGFSLRYVILSLRSFSEVPLIVMSHQKSNTELVTALGLGADDYVEATASLSILLARVFALLRRTGNNKFDVVDKDILVSGELVINPGTYEVYLSHQPLKISKTQFELLRLLAENHGAVVTHGRLKHALWRDQDPENGLLKKHVQRLRRNLGDSAIDPRWIASVHAVGYRFVGPTPMRLAPNNLAVHSLGSEHRDSKPGEVREA